MSKRSNPLHNTLSLLVVALLFSLYCEAAFAQSTAFTYQGKLSDSGAPANGAFDLQFKLFDDLLTPPGNQQGSTLTLSSVTVTAGIFTVTLDFGGGVFTGANRFLEIAVRPAGVGGFTLLSPRQPVTSNPYAIKSLNAAAADALSVACVNCVMSSQIASAPAGSASNYVQNTTTQQPGADFNVSGTGTANIFNAGTQYNIGGNRLLSVAGTANTFVGFGTGQANSTGFQNSFVGANAGNSNTTGGNNSFFGEASGISNTMGVENSFVGFTSGSSNTTGNSNSFFGRNAGGSNTTGGSNTIVGSFANVGANNLTNATALGAGAIVSQSNSLVLGSNGVNVGIGASAPVSRLHLNGNAASFAVTFTNIANTAGRRGYRLAFDNDRFSFQRADDFGNFVNNQIAIDQATGNVGIGETAPLGKLQVVTANDTNPSVITAWDARHFVVGATASSGGVGMSYDQTNNLGYFGAVRPNVAWGNLILQSGGGNVGIGTGTTAPNYKLEINDPANKGLRVLTNASGGTIASFGGFGDFVIDTVGVVGGRVTVKENGNVGIGTNSPNAKLQVVGGSIYIANPSSLVITSPNGTCWFITVNNAGALSTVSVPCP